MDIVKVKIESRFFIECPNGCCEEDVDTYENSVFECITCKGKWKYSSDPSECDQV